MMEFIVTVIVMIVFFLTLGIDPMIIIDSMSILLGILILLGEVLLILMSVFFMTVLVLLLVCKPVKAQFLYIMKHKIGTYAVYRIEGEVYKNTFPAEIVLADKIYRKGKISTARLHKGKKKCLLFDWYSFIVIGVGLPASVIMSLLLGRLILLWTEIL